MSDLVADPGNSAVAGAPERADREPPRVRVARVAYTVLAWIFAICVALQVFLAGLAIFDGPAWWSEHRSFVHLFEFVPLLMLVAALLGNMSTRAKWLSLLAFGLVALQYGFVILGSVSGAALAALHPVNALLIFGLAIRLATGRDNAA